MRGTLHLSDERENAEDDVQVVLGEATRPEQWTASVALLAASLYRKRAVCGYLTTGLAEPFFAGEMQAAAVYVAHLGAAGAIDAAASETVRPFFDAVAGGYWDAARRIAASRAEAWASEREYEEDFAYATFLMALVGGGAASERVTGAALERYVEVAGYDARSSVCRALMDRDELEFHRGLIRVLEERSEQIDGYEAGGHLADADVDWLRPVSIEGCALVRIAERLGVAAEIDLPQVPAPLRREPPFPFAPDAWRSATFSPDRR